MVVPTDQLNELFSDAYDKVTLPAYKPSSLGIAFKDDETVTKPVYSGKEPTLPFAKSSLFLASIQASRRLTALNDDCKSVYEITFGVQESNFEFKAGDTIGIIPQNNTLEVEAILNHLDLHSKADLTYTLSSDGSSKIAPHIPISSTLRYVLINCVDIRSVVKKLFLLTLSKYTKNDKEKRVLEYLCSKEGSAMYNNYILNKNMCILDIFLQFKSCKPPIEILLNNLNRLLPRPYSIVNSGIKHPHSIKICFSVMEIANNRKGITTSWLEQLILQETNLDERMMQLNLSDCKKRIPIYLRSNMSGFSLPESVETPLVLVGPGTGVAPFIGFLEDREIMMRNSNKKSDVWLFFGCRDPKLDYLYENELCDFVNKEVLTKLSTAYSRVHGLEEKYVQNKILLEGEHVVNLIQKGASIFVCGDVKTMATQVREAFINCLCKYQNMNNEAAEEFFKDMEKQKRYVVDVWS